MIRLSKPLLCGLAGLLAGASAAAQSPSPAPAPVAAAPAAQEPAFDIWEYEIEGNTVLGVEAIEAAVRDHLGPDRSMKDVDAARNALEAAYQKAGYLTVLVDVPEQRVDGGIVLLQVIEGQVGGLYVTGSRYHSQGYIRNAVTGLAPGTVPNFNEVQQQLALVNRTEDRRVQPVLKPGRLPGTVDVELQVNDEFPISGSVEINNQHSRDTDPARVSATVRYDNLFQRDHSLSLTAITAPTEPSQSQVLVANYGIPLEGANSWSASLVWSNSDVETLGSTQVISRGTTFSLRRYIAFGRADGSRLLSLGFDLKNTKERSAFDTPVRYMPFQLGYTDQWAIGADRLQVNANVAFAIASLLKRDVPCPSGVNPEAQADQFACKRFGASGSFGAFKLDSRWFHPLGPAMLVTRLGLQIASGPLISAEQYSLGGADTVRGYLEGEASGDHGVLGSLELRAPNLASSFGEFWRDVTPLAFLDVANAVTLQPLPGQASRTPLLGSGVGLRLATRGLEASLDFARAAKATAATDAGNWRLHARLLARF
ncbi:MAG TPA: ShlB/FhaC/HecB family hemolysin secretion/activation protein [Ideonella sp.]|nr:ShlB/FhaC/HecB family hemolysin secretion/activation protein [Ideonella sp.]